MSSTPIQQAKLELPLPLLMRRLGLGEHAKKSARCPFHDDKRNSFSIWHRDGVWYWKCFAGCGHGDEITLLEKHKGISIGEAIKLFREMAGCAPVGPPPAATRRDNPERANNKSFDWQACVDALTESDLERLSNERWYSRAFCEWLREKQLVGVHNGHVAFPNGNGTVKGAHVWSGSKDWYHHPAGVGTHPFVIDDLAQAKQIHLFESQWDKEVHFWWCVEVRPPRSAPEGNRPGQETLPSEVGSEASTPDQGTAPHHLDDLFSQARRPATHRPTHSNAPVGVGVPAQNLPGEEHAQRQQKQ